MNRPLRRPHDSTASPACAVRRTAGFSLVEVLMALSIGAIAFFPILTVFQSSIKLNVQQSYWAQARQIAEKNMDEILALPFKDIAPGVNAVRLGTVGFPRASEIKGTRYNVDVAVRVLSPIFTYRTRNLLGEIIPDPASPIPVPSYKAVDELKEITVTVAWTGVNARMTFPLVTYKADLRK